MENRSTRMPHSRATRKCPPSCKTMSRPSPMIATSIDSINGRLAWSLSGDRKGIQRSVSEQARWPADELGRRRLPSGGQESKNGAEEERHRWTRARSHHVDAQLLRAPLEHGFEQHARPAGAHDH